ELDLTSRDGMAVTALERPEGEDAGGRVVDSVQALVRGLALARHVELLAVDLRRDERLRLGRGLLRQAAQRDGGQHRQGPSVPHLSFLLDRLRATRVTHELDVNIPSRRLPASIESTTNAAIRRGASSADEYRAGLPGPHELCVRLEDPPLPHRSLQRLLVFRHEGTVSGIERRELRGVKGRGGPEQLADDRPWLLSREGGDGHVD